MEYFVYGVICDRPISISLLADSRNSAAVLISHDVRKKSQMPLGEASPKAEATWGECIRPFKCRPTGALRSPQAPSEVLTCELENWGLSW